MRTYINHEVATEVMRRHLAPLRTIDFDSWMDVLNAAPMEFELHTVALAAALGCPTKASELRKELLHAVMVETDPGQFVNLAQARALHLVGNW